MSTVTALNREFIRRRQAVDRFLLKALRSYLNEGHEKSEN